MTFDIQVSRLDVFPIVNTPNIITRYADIQHGTTEASPRLHFLGVQTGLGCDIFAFRYSCNPCTLQGLLRSRLQTPVSKTEGINERRANFVLLHRFLLRRPLGEPTASSMGSNLLG